jgi:hypothetical protein
MDAFAGRSRQWLGAVPAARIWAACQSLPPTRHRTRDSGIWREANGPRTPGARPILREDLVRLMGWRDANVVEPAGYAFGAVRIPMSHAAKRPMR